jgi:hypothetical protein
MEEPVDQQELIFSAERLIKELMDHEGAKGFSKSTCLLIAEWYEHFNRYKNSS